MSSTQPHSVILQLECGARFQGLGWGDFSKTQGGEFVFCTAMTGIEESLTDPSFAGQVLVSTVAHVGNTGFTGEDMESPRIWAEGLICRHLSQEPSNWRAKKPLKEWILSEGRFVVEGIDTRELTILLRENGSQRGVVYLEGSSTPSIESSIPFMTGRDLTSIVSTQKAYSYPANDSTNYLLNNAEGIQIAVWDFGVKQNTLRMLSALGASVTVLPSTAKADEILAAGSDGILLSNGPGDPAASTHIIRELRSMLGRKPIFGICLGHQLLALASGARTFKMKFGHRGIHHPVVELDQKGKAIRTWITSQNHGFAVDPESLPAPARIRFIHGDDHSVEGVHYPQWNAESVQFHPEAAPGPLDSGLLLRNFINQLIHTKEKDEKTKIRFGSGQRTDHHRPSLRV